MQYREYDEGELRKIQEIELELLRVFIEICEKLNINYFADGGTAIGAVRHQGFIPWDDDVDIGMIRDDYNKFIREAASMLPDYVSLQTPYNDVNCPYYYSKLRYNGTKFVEYCNHRLDINHGIYIDLFPFDEVPDDETLNVRQFNSFQMWIRIFTLHQFADLSQPPRGMIQHIKATMRFLAHYIVRMIPIKYIIRKLDRISTKYNGTNQSLYSGLTAPKRNWDCVKKEGYMPFVKMPFESISINLLKDYDFNLHSLYGDYMCLPPENQRKSHHPYVLDFGGKSID